MARWRRLSWHLLLPSAAILWSRPSVPWRQLCRVVAILYTCIYCDHANLWTVSGCAAHAVYGKPNKTTDNTSNRVNAQFNLILSCPSTTWSQRIGCIYHDCVAISTVHRGNAETPSSSHLVADAHDALLLPCSRHFILWSPPSSCIRWWESSGVRRTWSVDPACYTVAVKTPNRITHRYFRIFVVIRQPNRIVDTCGVHGRH